MEDQDSDLESDSSHGQPVQLPQNRSDMITAPRSSYKSSGQIYILQVCVTSGRLVVKNIA